MAKVLAHLCPLMPLAGTVMFQHNIEAQAQEGSCATLQGSMSRITVHFMSPHLLKPPYPLRPPSYSSGSKPFPWEGPMQVLLQLLLRSKASSFFLRAAGLWQWSQPLAQAGGASPKYSAMAAWRHLEQAVTMG